MMLTEPELRTLQFTLRCIAPLSLLACISVIISVSTSKHRANPENYCQMYIAFSEAILSCIWIAGTSIVHSTVICTVAGYLYEYFANAVSGWSLCVTVYCFVVVLHGRKRAERWLPYFHAYAWGQPTVLVGGLALAESVQKKGNIIGDATTHCWIGPNYADIRGYFRHVFLWLHICIIVCLYGYLVVKAWSLRRDLKEANVIIRHGDGQLKTSTVVSNLEFSEDPRTPGGLIENACQDENNIHSCEWDAGPASIFQFGSKLSIPLKPESNASKMLLAAKLAQTLSIVIRTSAAGQSESIPPTKKNRLGKRVALKGFLVATSFIFSWTPATALRIIQMLDHDVPFWMYEFMGISFCLMGTFNAAIFFMFLKKANK